MYAERLVLRGFGLSLLGIKEESIGGIIAEKVVDLAESLNKQHILDEISFYGTSDKDGSATFTFEWIGESVPPTMFQEIEMFLTEIKKLVISTKKEVREQECPNIVFFDGLARLIYRFRIWNEEGKYEYYDKQLAEI